MAAVTGIGGFFFRARNPDALNRWYAEHFGVVMIESSGYDDPGWFQDRGEAVFAAFAQDSESFGAPEKTWKINFRVSDLDGMIEKLRSAGVTVDPHANATPTGASLSSRIPRETPSSCGSRTRRRRLATQAL
jgi:glyoxylase I family protein